MLQVIDLKDASPERLADAEHIFASSFNSEECLPWPRIERSLRTDIRVGHGALRHDRLLGFAVTLSLGDGVALLEYLAVDAAARSGGVGAVLLQAVLNRAAFEGHDRVVVQVEHPGYGDDRETRRRRIRFYARQGARVVDTPVDRIVPNRNAPGTTPMLLLDIAHGEAGPLDAALLADVLTSIWVRSYGRDHRDTDLRTILRSLDGEYALRDTA